MPPDFSTLIASINFSPAIVSILAVFATVATAYVVLKAGDYILGAIYGERWSDPYYSIYDHQYDEPDPDGRYQVWTDTHEATDEQILMMSDEEFDEYERNHPDD